MDVVGSIDNAGGMLDSLGKQRFHLIFTRTRLVIVTPMDLRRAARENLQSSGSFIQRDSMTRKNVIDILEEKGQEIEKNLDEYVTQNRDKVRIVDYDSISSVRLLKGNPFKLPSLIVRTDESEMYFNLQHDNYRGTGKLDSDVFERYLSVLKETLGDKVKTK